jgi:hypothetical protein
MGAFERKGKNYHLLGLFGALLMAALLLALVLVGPMPDAQAQLQGPENHAHQRGQGDRPVQGEANPLVYKSVQSRPDFTGGYYKHVLPCPAGYKAISGGFDLNTPSQVVPDEFHPAPRAWSLISNRPTQDGSGWIVEAQIPTFDVTGSPVPTFWAMAACAPQDLLTGLNYVQQEGDLNRGENRTISANCDAGQVTLGGGFDFGFNDFSLVRSERTREGGVSWQVGAKNQGGSLSRLYAWAVCVSGDALQNAQYLEDAETANTQVAASTNGCPQGTYMLAGGAGTPNSVWDRLAFTYWDRSGPASVPEPYTWGNWTASIKWSLQNNPITVHAFALCGRFADQPGLGGGKPSGKNRGWGDGVGGGRFK